jgi:hypothetical protein
MLTNKSIISNIVILFIKALKREADTDDYYIYKSMHIDLLFI